jgi:hypothetical protein
MAARRFQEEISKPHSLQRGCGEREGRVLTEVIVLI